MVSKKSIQIFVKFPAHAKLNFLSFLIISWPLIVWSKHKWQSFTIVRINYQENSLGSETRINISHEVYLLASQWCEIVSEVTFQFFLFLSFHEIYISLPWIVLWKDIRRKIKCLSTYFWEKIEIQIAPHQKKIQPIV